ncbi:family 3 glycoside hydrolase [Penicillium cataractarum]|uniref:beta-glucosidase n=1 Tax=Penicillium cataractarum TaxID=2100454 RepID=A0A9W9S7W2_9EURO|nr:family 3 glycoside hydrolase [Penicillium cataractarum]KAJ5371233.1 family 3 glycoside hydrolase [Penicillium cataractarum]
MASVDLKAVLASLTLEEKASLLAGANFWETMPIPAKGVPAVKMSDGPNGARGAAFANGTTAACFPAACCVGSTFDVDLAKRIGSALAEETLTKGARCILAPTMCIHRHPLGGRNFESFSEDPFLTGKMAAQVVCGVQDRGVAATIKHFAVNEQETDRLTVDETVSERTLREIYLRPFEIAVKEAKPWAVMTAYNMINGHHADSNEFLLKKVLRGDWKWEGMVMSDWGGTNSTAAALNAGLDLEMPGPTRFRQVEVVVEAVKSGQVSEQTIDDRVIRILEFLERLGCFKDDVIPEEKAVNKPEHQALIREVGAKGIVMLKNENNILPLSKEKVKGKQLALLGHAKIGMAHGGGSASVNAHYRVTPWDALHEALGDNVKFSYAKGAHTFRMLPYLRENVVDLTGGNGFTYKLFEPGQAEPFYVKQGHEESFIDILSTFDVVEKEASLEGTFTATETDSYYFTCSGIGPSKLVINDELIYEQTENCKDPMGFIFGGAPAPQIKVPLKAGEQYKIFAHTSPPSKKDGEDDSILAGRIGLRIGYMSATEHDKDLVAEAVEVAKAADVAIVFVGHETFWETEGQDQVSFNLPKDGSQDRLISAVAAVNPNTIVVNSTGVAVAMPWLDQVQGLLQAWFPGQEVGNSIADVLTGRQNPEGHLPCTFPKRLEDCPAYGNFPGERDHNGQMRVTYKEGVFVGYRHFDRLPADTVNFPFGFGLSYTTFDFSDLSVKQGGDGDYAVTVKVVNTGSVAGATAVQIYVGNALPSSANPPKALAAFKKVFVQPGETSAVTLTVGSRDLATFDEATQKWITSGGDYEFMVARSAGDIVLRTSVSVGRKESEP